GGRKPHPGVQYRCLLDQGQVRSSSGSVSLQLDKASARVLGPSNATASEKTGTWAARVDRS
ncbi:MAG: hypothetical protein AABY90_09190, partial [Nitrospirota bacterium]